MRVPRPAFWLVAVAFELGLGLLAWVLGLLLGAPPLRTLRFAPPEHLWQLEALVWGVCAALPPWGLMIWCDRARPPGLRRLAEFVEQEVVPWMRSSSTWQLALMSLAAGVGEEMLFRGWMQPSLEGWLEPWLPAFASGCVALGVASAVFGVTHWLTPTYALAATVMGLYLGALFAATDSLLAPIAAHALYDFLALAYLTRRAARR